MLTGGSRQCHCHGLRHQDPDQWRGAMGTERPTLFHHLPAFVTGLFHPAREEKLRGRDTEKYRMPEPRSNMNRDGMKLPAATAKEGLSIGVHPRRGS